MNFTLRQLTLNDANALLEFAKSAFVHTYADHNTPENMALYVNSNFTIQKVITELTDVKNIFHGIFLDNDIVGYSKLRPNNYETASTEQYVMELERIYVSSTLQGQKIGKRLLENCLEYSKLNKFSELWLGVWENNQKAIAFYKKMKFEKFGEHVFMLGTDAQTDYLMRLEINKMQK